MPITSVILLIIYFLFLKARHIYSIKLVRRQKCKEENNYHKLMTNRKIFVTYDKTLLPLVEKCSYKSIKKQIPNMKISKGNEYAILSKQFNNHSNLNQNSNYIPVINSWSTKDHKKGNAKS